MPLGASDVRAVRVFDSADPASLTYPERLAVDANVIYWTHYSGAFGFAAGAAPTSRQTIYPQIVAAALKRGAKLCAPVITLIEAAGLMERAELEGRWYGDPQTASTAFSLKAARTHWARDLQGIHKHVTACLGSAFKTVKLLPEPKISGLLGSWSEAVAGPADAGLVAAVLDHQVGGILSDDADLVTFSAIKLFTVNRVALDAARKAGRLS